MGLNLAWSRDCWSLFVTNLAPSVTTKVLFDVFQEAGPVFDVFLLKDRITGKGRGFGYVGLSASRQNGMRIGQFKDYMEEC